MRVLALDAAGVLYKVGDDVGDVLTPFVRERGGAADKIPSIFWDPYLGRTTTAEFWRAVGLDPDVEADYVAHRELNDGVVPFLERASRVFDAICCLSNDAGEWSAAARRRFGLERHIKKWFISGDLGLNKPKPEIYGEVLREYGIVPGDLTFVDDLPENIAAAAALGVDTVLFGPAAREPGSGKRAATMAELSSLLT